MLRVEGLSLAGLDGRAVLRDVSFTIHKGEVLGIAGVEGNGQAELVETIMGMREPTAGRVVLGDEDVTEWSTRRLREAGIGYIPEDRHRHGLLLEAPLWENRILGHQTQEPNVKGPWIDRSGARKDTARIVKAYDVRTPGIDVLSSALSGGNQQKFIVGREMSNDPVVLVAAHPTRGVDVGAQAAIWDHIRDARRRGLAVLLISADLDELIGLSDTIKVILRGAMVGGVRPVRRHARAARIGHDGSGRVTTVRSRLNVRDAALSMAAPILAVAFATAVGSLILFVAGDPVGETWQVMFDTAKQPRSIALIVNQGAVYYLSAIAVAIGFRMNLFNIGVDGQYRLAAFVAALTAAVHPGAWLRCGSPPPILAAMLTGALWAGIAGAAAGHPRRQRGHLDDHAERDRHQPGRVTSCARSSVPVEGSNNIGTKLIPESARIPGIPLIPDSTQKVYGLVVVAVVAGIAYSVLLNRTRFGFDLRATGHSESAAQASGVNVKRMVLTAMLISGAFAGLVGLPELLGQAYTYSLTFPAGLGFIGIAIALLGRNHPLGIAVGAALFSFLDVAANPLQIIADVSSEIVTIMQGIIVLAVVIAYEVIRRYRVTQEQRRVARQLEAPTEAQGVPA